MIEFKPVRAKDREIFEKYYPYKTFQNAESSFANLCAYSFIYNGEYAIIDNCLITRIHFVKDKEICYHQIIGQGDKTPIIKKLITDAKEKKQKISIICDNKDKCEVFEERDFFDYLYLREDLQHLKGRKYQPKRNHINKFTSKYQWEYVELNSQNCFECLPLLDKWKQQSIETKPELIEDYEKERKVIEYLFNNFDDLDLYLGAIKVENQIVAFSIGSKINSDTFDIHIEKANRDYEGAFALINREIATHIPQNYLYINREEDLGIEGLRKAKLSYYPVKLIEKCFVHLT